MHRHQQPTADGQDEGYVLIMAMVLITVLAMVVLAIANYTGSALKAGTTVKTRVDRLSASDGGMKIALQQLRTKAVGCGSATSTVYSGTVNGQAVSVTCQRTQLLSADIGGFAAVITADGVPNGTSSLIAQGTNVASRPRSLGGNVYLAVPPASLDKPVQVADGDLYYYSAGTCTEPTYNNLTFKPADERSYVCTNTTWNTLFPRPTLPAKVTTSRSSTGKTNAKGCTVFQPGVYTKAPVIGAGTQNFFEPGVYYFQFDGDIQIKNATVVGGTTGITGGGSSAVARTATTFATPWCQTAIDAFNKVGITNTGVTWVFGGNSRITVDPNGQLELFASPKIAASDIFPPTIVALRSSTSDFNANTLGSMGNPLIDLQEGSSNGVTIHGGVWAPGSYINIGNIAQSANGQFLGGLVVGRLNLQTAASAGSFNIKVVTKPSTRRLVLESKAGQITTRVVTLMRSGVGDYVIQSRRVT